MINLFLRLGQCIDKIHLCLVLIPLMKNLRSNLKLGPVGNIFFHKIEIPYLDVLFSILLPSLLKDMEEC